MGLQTPGFYQGHAHAADTSPCCLLHVAVLTILCVQPVAELIGWLDEEGSRTGLAVHQELQDGAAAITSLVTPPAAAISSWSLKIQPSFTSPRGFASAELQDAPTHSSIRLLAHIAPLDEGFALTCALQCAASDTVWSPCAHFSASLLCCSRSPLATALPPTSKPATRVMVTRGSRSLSAPRMMPSTAPPSPRKLAFHSATSAW